MVANLRYAGEAVVFRARPPVSKSNDDFNDDDERARANFRDSPWCRCVEAPIKKADCCCKIESAQQSSPKSDEGEKEGRRSLVLVLV